VQQGRLIVLTGHVRAKNGSNLNSRRIGMKFNASNIPIIMQSVAVSALCITAIIIWNRIIPKRKTTIDMLSFEQTNSYMLSIREGYLALLRNGRLTGFSTAEKWYTAEAFPLVSTLNRYEIVAIGINEGAIDADIYRRYWRTNLVRNWKCC
jgi:hypothetical protein